MNGLDTHRRCRRRMRRQSAIAAVLSMLVVAAGALPTGCSRTEPGPFPMVDGATAVTLSAGDEVQVKIRYFPDLGETQAIRPDGKIALEMIDDVQAAGLTPEQLDERITDLYKDKIKDPIVTVVVRSLAGQRVYVAGEVATPGEVALNGQMTAAQAIMAAGGFDKTRAKPSSVIVVRRVAGKQYAAKVDLSGALSLEPGEPFYLAPMDIVYVPDTVVEKIGTFVEKYINRVVPAGLSYSHPMGNGDTIGYAPPLRPR